MFIHWTTNTAGTSEYQCDGIIADVVIIVFTGLHCPSMQTQLHKISQVCVEPRPSAPNMMLPAFADERWRLQHGAPAVDRYLL